MTSPIQSHVSDPAGEFRLAPTDCPSREQLERAYADPIVITTEPAAARWPQFSLRDIMIVMAGVAGGLAGA